jgi:hypothetical protein
MSLELSLLGWSAKGFRCPDHEISMERTGRRLHKSTLIQMPNGTGKTTTLELLRAALSGGADKWPEETVKDFAKPDTLETTGVFLVNLLANDKPLTFELTFDFERGKARYRTTYASGVRHGFNPPPTLSPFFRPQFVRLFVFDGELASHLLDSRLAKAREAVDSLFQLSLLDDLAGRFAENWTNRASRVSAKEEKGLTRRRNELESLQVRLKKLQSERRSLSSKVTTFKKQLANLEGEYNASLVQQGDIGVKLEKVLTELRVQEEAIRLHSEHSVNRMRDPQSLSTEFSIRLQSLRENLDRLKLPDTTSRAFFVELAQEKQCICGRNLDDTTRQAILDRADSYLGADEFGVLNSIKSDIATYASEPAESYVRDLQEVFTRLGQAVADRGRLDTDRQALEAEQLAEGDSALNEQKAEIDRLKGELVSAEQRLNDLSRDPEPDDDSSTDCIKSLERFVRDAERKYAEITETLDLKRKTDTIQRILIKTRDEARSQIRRMLVTETNERIATLLKRTPVILEDIQDSLMLRAQRGASVGQTLSVGYSFLATLFQRAEHTLPFVVDSPAGSLDLAVRSEVARLLPKLSKQCIAFTISSERASFVDSLHKAAGEDVQYVTIFRKSSVTKELRQRISEIDKADITESLDGYLVAGKEFFDAFDVDEERR